MNKEGKFLFLCFLLLSNLLTAQQSIVLSQFSQDKASFNPSYIGFNQIAYVSAFHRSQWLGYEDEKGYGAPSTQYVSVQVPIGGLIRSAMGLSLIQDNLGPISTVDVRLGLAFTKRLNRMDWSFSIQPAFKSRRIRSDILNPVDRSDPTLQELLERSSVNSFGMDANLGLNVSTENYSAGLGLLNLLESNLDFLSSTGKLAREVNFYATYNLMLAYKFELTPFLLTRSDLNSLTLDLGTYVTYDEKLSAGLSYRKEESISFLLTARKFRESNLSLGFAFDFIVSNASDKKFNSLEFFVQYDLPEFGLGKRKIIRTPRFRY